MGRGSRRGVTQLLPFAADVAGQDDRHVAEPQLEHDGVVVAHALTLPFGRRRMQNANLDSRRRLAVARLHDAPRRSRAGGMRGERTQARVRRNRDTFPDRSRRKPPQHGPARRRCDRDRHGSHERVQPANAEAHAARGRRRARRGRSVETRRCPPRVDEQRASVRQARERGVSLADVEEHHPQRAGGDAPEAPRRPPA